MKKDMEREPYTKVAVLESEIEAQILDSILNEQGIPHHIQSYHDTAYDGIYQAQKGWGRISAPAAWSEEIKEILSDIRATPNTP
jgi:hypothetical protein